VLNRRETALFGVAKFSAMTIDSVETRLHLGRVTSLNFLNAGVKRLRDSALRYYHRYRSRSKPRSKPLSPSFVHEDVDLVLSDRDLVLCGTSTQSSKHRGTLHATVRPYSHQPHIPMFSLAMFSSPYAALITLKPTLPTAPQHSRGQG
jgi:hypothetical protein